jgi:hypothetical protein
MVYEEKVDRILQHSGGGGTGTYHFLEGGMGGWMWRSVGGETGTIGIGAKAGSFLYAQGFIDFDFEIYHLSAGKPSA